MPTVICEQNATKKQIITEKSLIKANKNGFGNEVGAITNRCTAMFDVLAKFEKDSPQYEDMLYRITCMQGYQQEIIDSCKGIIPKRVPKEWYSYKAVKNKDTDDEGMKIVKEYQRSLLANKKPYFFIYNYKYLKNDYNNYNKNADNNCIIKFGLTLDELRNKQDKTDEENNFLCYYEKLSPVSNNDSIVNRIAHKLEDKLDKLPMNIRKSNFDKNILITDKHIKKRIEEDLVDLYKKYNTDIRNTMKSNVNKIKDSVEEIKNNRELYMKSFIEKANEICKNDSEILCNALVKLLYDKTNSKQFLWDICGDYIINKLLNENNNTINFPVKDINGNILWDGEKYSIKSMKIKEEIEC